MDSCEGCEFIIGFTWPCDYCKRSRSITDEDYDSLKDHYKPKEVK